MSYSKRLPSVLRQHLYYHVTYANTQKQCEAFCMCFCDGSLALARKTYPNVCNAANLYLHIEYAVKYCNKSLLADLYKSIEIDDWKSYSTYVALIYMIQSGFHKWMHDIWAPETSAIDKWKGVEEHQNELFSTALHARDLTAIDMLLGWGFVLGKSAVIHAASNENEVRIANPDYIGHILTIMAKAKQEYRELLLPLAEKYNLDLDTLCKN